MTNSGFDRRITVRLIAYWEKMRGNSDMPSREDIVPGDINDLWDHCFIINIKDLRKSSYDYAYLGAAIAEAYRSGGIDTSDETMVSQNASKLASSFDRLIMNPRPLIEEGEFVGKDKGVVKYRQCLLPLGRNGKVEAIFGGMRFKVFIKD